MQMWSAVGLMAAGVISSRSIDIRSMPGHYMTLQQNPAVSLGWGE